MEPLYAIRLDDEVLELPADKLDAIIALSQAGMQAHNAELLLAGLIGERAKDIGPKLLAWAVDKFKTRQGGGGGLPTCWQAHGVMLMDDAGVWRTVWRSSPSPVRVVVGC